MGERTLRRLLIIGASAVVRWAARKGTPAGSCSACQPTAHARRCRARQQNGTYCLGHAGQGRHLSRFDRGGITPGRRLSRVGRSYGGHGAIVPMRQDRENQFWTERLERAEVKWTRSLNSHTGPQQVKGRSSRPDTCRKLKLNLTFASWFLKANRKLRRGVERSGCRSAPPRRLEDTIMTTEQKIIRAKVGLLVPAGSAVTESTSWRRNWGGSSAG